MHQFFIITPIESPQLSDEQIHQCQKVLRLRPSDQVLLVDPFGSAAIVTLDFTQSQPIQVQEHLLDLPRTLPEITLCVTLIRSERLEWVIQKATELGVSRIVLVDSSRTVMKIKPNDYEKKLRRYQKIALEAAEQSQRRDIPLIEGVIALKDIDKYLSEVNAVCYENATSQHLKHLVTSKSMSIIIGPEGGFSEQEIEMLMNKNIACVTLGSRIYRAETASLYALSCISTLLEG